MGRGDVQKKSFDELLNYGREGIEKKIREYLCNVCDSRIFLTVKKTPASKDIAGLINFKNKEIKNALMFPPENISLLTTNEMNFQFHSGFRTGTLSRKAKHKGCIRFGRSIKDWVILRELYQGNISVSDINAGLSFFDRNRSFVINAVSNQFSSPQWEIRYSDKHHYFEAPPLCDAGSFEVMISCVPEHQAYYHLITKLPIS